MATRSWSVKAKNSLLTQTWNSKGALIRASVPAGVADKTVFSATRTSVVTANFRNLANPPVNPFYFYSNRYSGIEGWADQWASDGSHTRISGDHLEPMCGDFANSNLGKGYTSYAALPTSVKDAAIALNANKLLLQIKDQKVNLAQVYAERAQTADLFASTAKRIVGTISSLRRGRIAEAAKHLGLILPRRKKARMRTRWLKDQASSIGSNLLELRYGWEPLLADVYGACEVIAARDIDKVEYPASECSTQRRQQSDDYYHSGACPYPGMVRRKTIVQWTVRTGVKYRITSSGLQTLSQLGITNPAVILWELTPWSFVIDWMLPIGNWLSTWDATLGLSFVDGYRTVFQRVNVEFTKVGFNSNRRNAGTDCVMWGTREEIYCKREKLITFPSPTVPQLKNPFSTQHVQNALALLSNLLRK